VTPCFDAERFMALVRERGLSLGTPLSAVEETDSTNDDALAAARSGAPHGATFLAESQRRGRGRRGRSWLSPPGENLLFSLVLRPGLEPERVSSLTLVVGLAVREAVSLRTRAEVRVKWPNDVIVAGKKLAGILVESQLVAGRIDAVVAGIGINVGRVAAEVSDLATSLGELGCAERGREALLCDVFAALEVRLETHARAGISALLDELRTHDALAGQQIRVDTVTGIARGFDATGALLIDDGTSLRPIVSGTVELLEGSTAHGR
jgi:BirA family transcriptional regulator, biotin operon repressor / biotin---[acetyl-CoA-carboxylase] ligase